MNIVGKRLAENLLPLLLGVLAFFLVVGPRVLDTANIAWLGQGDPATHYLGWLFFRNSEWSFPIGLNPTYGLEIGSAIIFSDSNPLFAFLFKPFAPLLSEPFQYFGIWLLACFVLQAWFGWKLVGLISDSVAVCILAAGLFVFAPPMIFRLNAHLSLVGHFLILAALYFSFHPGLERRRLAWSTLLAVAALVHAYLLAMVGLLWFADFAGKTIKKKLPFPQAVLEPVIMVSATGLACWQAGYFSVGAGTSAGGFGIYRMNLLSIFNANGWSYFLKNIPTGCNYCEGSNFLGLGVIFILVTTVPAVICGGTRVMRVIREFPILLMTLVGFTAFAASNKLSFGLLTFEYTLPDLVLNAANIFRASERMFWPVFYVIIFAAIFLVVRSNDKRTAVILLGLALVIQITDTSAAWLGIRKKLMTEPQPTWGTSLVDPFWGNAAFKYKKVRWIQPMNNSPKWITFAAYAGSHGLATNTVYLARIGSKALEQARHNASEAVRTATYEADSLYILDDQLFRQAAVNINLDIDLLARIDGFNILAPGWKKCTDCPDVTGEVKLIDLLAPIKANAKMLLSQSGSGVAYLSGGWSAPEAGGTWSDGAKKAEIILPAPDKVSTILIEARALVTTRHPKQDVEIAINNVHAFSTSLTKPTENLMKIPIPEAVQEKLAERGFLRLQFQFKNAVRPKDIGINEDNRKLALTLRSITLY